MTRTHVLTAAGIWLVASMAPASTILLEEQFSGTRFDGMLPDAGRWVQNATTVEGGAVTAQIVESAQLGGKALRVSNVGWVQWTSAAFPVQQLEAIGDQLVLSFDVMFASGGLKHRDHGFVVGFLDQKDTPIATLDATADFGNFGTGRSNNWSTYFFKFATGEAGGSQFGRRSPAATFQAWWADQAQALGSFSGPALARAETVYSVTIGMVKTGANELTAYLDAPQFSGERRLFVDSAAIAERFDAIGFRAEYPLDVDPDPPVFLLANIRLEFIAQGPLPGDTGGGPGEPPGGDRGTAPELTEPEMQSSFLGTTRIDTAPWVWTSASGWIYAPLAPPLDDAQWMHVQAHQLGWIYTSAEHYPWFYSVNIGGWAYALSDFAGADLLVYSALDGVISGYPLRLRERYVAPWGSDDNPGTLSQPLRTVQRGLEDARPGDTLYLREGVYEESLMLRNSGTAGRPITVAAYGGPDQPESVTLSALSLVTPGQNGFGEWELLEDQIYRIQIPADRVLNGSKTLVFANGQALTPARYPDSVDFWQVRRDGMLAAETLTEGTGGRRIYSHPALGNRPTNAWRGAYIHFFPGYAWYEAYRVVEFSNGETIEFIPPANPLFAPVAGDIFYLYETLTALTQPGEFFFDWRGNNGPANVLYVWLPDGGNPVDADIRYRSREYAILSTNASHYRFQHLNIVAGWSRFLGAASDIELDHVAISYAGFNNEFWAQEGAVDFRGPRSVFRNGSILYSRGFNLRAQSADQLVENSVLGFGNWGNLEGHGLDGTVGLAVRGNTIFSAAGVNVNINGRRSTYTRNHVYGGGYAATDIANMNAHGGEDAQGTVVSYNWVHGAYGIYDPERAGHNGGFGIRVDAGEATGNYRVFRNVVWDVSRHDISVWGLLSSSAQLYGNVQNYVFHNTVEDEIAVAPMNRGNPQGTYLWNNLMLGSFAPIYNMNNPDTVFEFNVVGSGSWGPDNHTGDPRVRAFSQQDFTLLPDSPAIDFGRFIADFPQPFSGAYPDAGAYESGLPAWYPGARLRAVDLPQLRLEPHAAGGSRVVGLPIGRKPTDEFRVRLGAAGEALPVTHFYDAASHHSEVWVDLEPGPAWFSLDGIHFVRGQ